MLQDPLMLFFAFVVGLAWGSFLNVFIYRIPLEKSLIKPNSQCPSCNTPIRIKHNIPLISFILLKGKCASCGWKIPWRYPLVELITGFLFMLGTYWANTWIELPFYAYFLSALIVSTFIDLDHWIIPDVVTLPGVFVGLFGAWIIPSQYFPAHLIGALAGGGLLLLLAYVYAKITKQEGLGGGDIKFLAMIGAFLGPQGVLVTVILAAFSGSIVGIFLILIKGKSGKTAIPFGPFLASGALLAFLFGDPLWQWYFRAI